MGCVRCNNKVHSSASLDGKTAVVTGCNTGIGKVTVQELVKRGCHVVMACRDVAKAEAAADEIRRETEGVEGAGRVTVTWLDLASLASVRQCAQHLLRTERRIHLLINNGGVAFCPKALTEDGFETHFAVNHLGHFVLTMLLLPRILASAPARIIAVSSSLHTTGSINFDDLNWEKSYSEVLAYANTKLANILFIKHLSKLLHEHGVDNVTTYAVHPGAVNTDGQRHLDTAFGCCVGWVYRNVLVSCYKTPEQGARTTVYCAVDEDLAEESGLYYSDCKQTTPSSKARDPMLAQRLWEETVRLVKLDNYDPFASGSQMKPIMDQPR